MGAICRSFPTHFASEVTGVTPRTLLNWCTRNFVRPSVSPGRTGPGGERLYSFRDLVAIRVADVLRQAGIDVRHLPLVVDYIRKRDGLEVDQPFAADTYLVNDSRGFRELQGTISIVEVRQGAIPEPLSILVIPLGELVTELQAKARARNLCRMSSRRLPASDPLSAIQRKRHAPR
jgi:DNA-binding transcriptional MerR regulator